MCKKRYTCFLLVFVLSIVLTFSSACDSDKGGLADFEDPVLFNLIKKQLGKDKIYKEDLAKFTEIIILGDEFVFILAEDDELEADLYIFSGDSFRYDDVLYEEVVGTMKSLQDLKYFSSLTYLSVLSQPGIDFSTIPEELHERIVALDIGGCNLKDISFLEKYNNLRLLHLADNNIKDLSPLEGKAEIGNLYLNNNEIEDIGPLASLSSLKKLSASGNKISDLTPISGLSELKSIDFSFNLIEDISPLKELMNLKTAALLGNKITDVSPLKDFESFEYLDFRDNPVANPEVLSHITNVYFGPI